MLELLKPMYGFSASSPHSFYIGGGELGYIIEGQSD